MIVGLLMVWAGLLAFVAPRMLRRAAWPDLAPRAGICAWQALSVGALGALLLAGLVLAAPPGAWHTDALARLHMCIEILRGAYGERPGWLGVVTAGALGLAAWAGVRAALAVLRTRGRRRRARALLDLRTRACPSVQGATVVESEEPLAYCLPGRRRRVVVSTGALAVLDGHQLTAVLAHESQHLRGHHHLAVDAAHGLARAFPGVPVLRTAQEEIPRLVELLADDAAARRTDRQTVARALLAMATARSAATNGAPGGALAASGPGAVRRVQRLLKPSPTRWLAVPALAAVLLTGLVVPVGLAAAPALAATRINMCLDHA